MNIHDPKKVGFSDTIISAAQLRICPHNENLANGYLMSPSAQSPVVNKFLMLGKSDMNSSSGSTTSSPGSPVSSDSPVKLRDLPHTTTLDGCVAYVDVWSSDRTDNRSSVFRNFLIRMGATVVKKFTKEFAITHVVFKDGHKSVLQKALKRNIKIVTCLWVDRCRVLQKWVEEENYLFDTNSYKPAKRFYEMQPQDPEDSVRRSAERIKRRKARYEKKNARIMFQSPLVTNNFSGTPKDNLTPTDELRKDRQKILAIDTPYHPPSPFLFLNPSIVNETPLSDSMKRKMQRLREGKRVLSPPPSDDEQQDNLSSVMPTDLTPADAFHNQTRERFSPIADTQCFVKKSWRESGISPPRFDVSCDEVPETQQMVTPCEDTPAESDDGSPEGMQLTRHGKQSSPKDMRPFQTVHLDEDMEMTKIIYQENPTYADDCEQDGDSVVYKRETPDSTAQSLHLQLSCDSSRSHDNTTVLDDNLTVDSNNSENRDFAPTEQKVASKSSLPTSRKRLRKLLADEDCLKPASILLSPKSSTKNETGIDPGSPGSHRKSVELPQLGFSAYKTLTKSGRFFQRLPSSTPSECSVMSSENSPRARLVCSQSTDYEIENDSKMSLPVPIANMEHGLYDRIKMRNKRNSRVLSDETVKIDASSKKRKRREHRDTTSTSNSDNSTTPPKKKAMLKSTQVDRTLFCSQAAISILKSMKKRRSTMEFREPMSASGRRERCRKSARNRVLVLTNLHSDERFLAHKSVRQLSGFRISSTVRAHTTHVVCGAARRTMNVLRAIVRGLWLLSINWVTDSISAGFWLEEESYELPNLFPVAQKNRRSRTRCSTWRNRLFSEFDGHIYISDDTKPPQEDLRELVELGGGSTVGSPRRASICVGNPGRVIPAMAVVGEAWILDCITENRLMSTTPYLIEPT